MRARCVVELRQERRRVRVCWRCRREWSVTRDACPECAVWIAEGERDVPYTRLTVDATALRSAVGEHPRWSGPRVQRVTALVVRLTSDGLPLSGSALDMLTAHLVTLAQIIRVHEGQLDATPAGDLRALFAGPGHAQRAVRAALAVLDHHRSHPPIPERSIEARIGLNSGLAVHQRGGRLGGRALDSASELARLGRAGIALATEATYRHVAAWYDLVAVGVEGDAPGHASRYAVLGPKAEDSHALHETHAGPLVGRAAELAALDTALAALRAGRSQVISLVAEPGLGKSKLLTAWLERSRERGDLAGVTVLRGLGVAYGSAPGTTLRSVVRAVGGAEATDVAALVELGAHGHPAMAADRLAAWLARAGPVLLVVDDVHWADDASTAVLQALLERPPATPCLTILSFRPSAAGRLAWALERSQIVLRLPPLSAMESARLLHEHASGNGLLPAIREAVTARAQGNPLYLKEALALLQEHTAHAPAAAAVAVSALPATLSALILERVERFAAQRTARLKGGLSWLAQQPLERQRLLDEIASTESAIGMWLDRLETGDYADQVVIARCLRRLEALDFELLMARMFLGLPRPRLPRLAAAIERLASGSVAAHLTVLRERFETTNALDVPYEAAAAGDRAWARGQTEAARDYYRLALDTTRPGDEQVVPRRRLWERLADLAEHSGDLATAHAALAQGLAETPTASTAERVRLERRLAEVALAMGDVAAAAQHLAATRRRLTAAERPWWYATAALLRERQGRASAAVRLAHRAWACASRDDWAAVRAALLRARLAPTDTARRRWLVRAAERAPDDTDRPEWTSLCAQLATLGLDRADGGAS
jgi:hypothetical protein